MRTMTLAALGAALVAAAVAPATLPAAAQPVAAARDLTPDANDAGKLVSELHEEVAKIEVSLQLPDGKPYTGDMVVTHFRPNGPGPFPVVVFSHGRTADTRHDPPRVRAVAAARFWTRRGFAVFMPTRVGYGELGQAVDPEAGGTCANANYRPAVAAMAEQVARTVAFATTLPWVDTGRVVLIGVSYGGFATIGASAKSIPGVVGAINFAGGLGGNPKARPGEPCQGARIEAIAKAAGAQTRVPMLWLYAQNDQYWGADWPRRWHQAYTAAGGRAQFATFSAVGDDGHKLMSGGFTLWRPVVDRYLAELGFTPPKANSALAASQFARLDDVDKVPYIKPAARTDGYAKFLSADVPRAFAISPTGAWAWRTGQDAVELALNRCQSSSRSTCSLYAVDDRVVWKEGK